MQGYIEIMDMADGYQNICKRHFIRREDIKRVEGDDVELSIRVYTDIQDEPFTSFWSDDDGGYEQEIGRIRRFLGIS